MACKNDKTSLSEASLSGMDSSTTYSDSDWDSDSDSIEYPNPPSHTYQLRRLAPARAILASGIACIVWGCDALEFAHRLGSDRAAWHSKGGHDMLVRDLDVEETTERVKIAKQGIQLLVTMQGLGSTLRGRKVGKDWESAIWLADSLAKGRVQSRKNLTDMITAEHQENWARGLSQDRYQ
ncbi:hypothetical protein Q9L58_001514 [Maublancomyces gigas]|uniref:Uncharacterized protein n=1 Tax=Discina gigas TaxID=1032678 RepID=A0ABR3GU66_9PEZI